MLQLFAETILSYSGTTTTTSTWNAFKIASWPRPQEAIYLEQQFS